MAKKEKGATFAQNPDLIEEHLKAAFKAASDANTALREEVSVLRKQLTDDTAKLLALDGDIKKQLEEQAELARLLEQHPEQQLRYEQYIYSGHVHYASYLEI